MTTKTIECRDCKVAAKTVSNPQDNDMVTCTRCGASDTYENVMRLVSEQVSYQTAKMFQDKMKGMANSSKIMSYKGANLKKPSAQFVLNLNL